MDGGEAMAFVLLAPKPEKLRKNAGQKGEMKFSGVAFAARAPIILAANFVVATKRAKIQKALFVSQMSH